jgi:phospholipid/cholesterol/gamma-HCH transport system permease protein
VIARLSCGVVNKIDHWGRSVIESIEYALNVFLMIYLAFRATIFDQAQGLRTIFSVVSAQIYFTGYQALPLITVLALASGSIVIMQSSAQLSLLGSGDMIGRLLVMVIVREIAPLLTALVVIARVGHGRGIRARQHESQQRDRGSQCHGDQPAKLHRVSAFAGRGHKCALLSFYYICISLIGGFVVTKIMHDMPFAFYADSLAKAFTSQDVMLFLAKNTFSGLIIFIICCYQGLLVKLGPHEVPQVTTKAVVNSIIYVVVFNLGVTTWFYLNQLVQLGVL